MLLVHGLSGSRRWWAPTVPALAERFRVYTLDLPGFGSTRRSRRRALASAPAWLLGWMQAVGLPAAHVVGHSMGGYVALRLAAEAPAAVRRLVLVAPAGVPTGASLLGHAVPLAAAVRHLPLSFVPVLVRDALSAGPATIWRAARDLLAEDARLLHLAQVAAPTLLIWGSQDSLTPVSAAPLLRTAIPDARLLVLDGAGHVPMYERTSELNAALFAFLSGRVVGE